MQVFDLIKKYNIKAKRESGQNFLVDKNILQKIIQSADLSENENVLEVGPGLGVLTELLLEKTKKVFAVELDKSLYYAMKQEFRKVKNLVLQNSNILDLTQPDLQKIFESENYKIVANIPYNITSVFLRKFLEQFSYKPQQMVLLVQKEVAQRMTADPGQMSLLALSVQTYCTVSIIDFVSKNCFFPAPAVDSAIIKLTLKKEKFDPAQIKKMFQLARIGFSAKRKQLANNLANALELTKEQIQNILIALEKNPQIRAQELSLEDWRNLVVAVDNCCKLSKTKK